MNDSYSHLTKTYGFEKTLKAYMALLKHPDNLHHLTISPKKGYDDEFYHEALNHLIRILNKKVFGARYLSRGVFVKGFVVRERSEDGSLHFHIIIVDPNGELESATVHFRSSVCRAIPKVYGRHMRIFDRQDATVRGTRLIGSKSWCLQDYYRSSRKKGLEEYLTKTLTDRTVSWCDKNNLVGLMDRECVQFGVLDGIPQASLRIRYQVEAEFRKYENAS